MSASSSEKPAFELTLTWKGKALQITTIPIKRQQNNTEPVLFLQEIK